MAQLTESQITALSMAFWQGHSLHAGQDNYSAKGRNNMILVLGNHPILRSSEGITDLYIGEKDPDDLTRKAYRLALLARGRGDSKLEWRSNGEVYLKDQRLVRGEWNQILGPDEEPIHSRGPDIGDLLD